MKNYPCVEMLPQIGAGQGDFRAVFQKDTIWKPGTTGTISITFGEARCSGCSTAAAWSMIGSQSANVNPSMNLGFIDPPRNSFEFKGKTYPYNLFSSSHRNFDNNNNWEPGATVIHEFCHALGMMHEHQNNLYGSNKIKLNKQNVINYYVNQGFGELAAEVNVLEWYNCNDKQDCNYEGSVYDPHSIMLYPLPDEFIERGYKNPTKGNFKLSNLDIIWLNREYPIDRKDYPQLTVKFIDIDDNDEWKRAWITKTIIEKLAPYVGIIWKFETNIPDINTVIYNPSEETNLPPIPKKKIPLLKIKRENFTNKITPLIIIIILIALVALYFIM